MTDNTNNNDFDNDSDNIKIENNQDNLKLMDYLKILNCEPNETNFMTIKKNYIKLIKKYHPDLNNDSEESKRKTSEITAAYNYIKSLIKERE